MKPDLSDVSHDDFLEMIEMGDPIYYTCKECGSAGLPPKKACPDCGDTRMIEKELSHVGEVASFTEIHIPTPMFQGEAPFTVVIVEFDEGVRLTGQLRGADEIEIGEEVEIGIEQKEEDRKLVTFTPV